MDLYQKRNIELELTASAGKTYKKVPFTVESNTEYIVICGDYATMGTGSGAIDIGLEDPAGKIRGWSGNLKRLEQILIAEEQASFGYLAGPIAEGTWQILLGDTRKHQQSIYVTLVLELHPYRQRIVRGDIHGHSLHSDGAHSIETKLQMARECGLDFLGFTDHNSISQNACLPINSDVLLLPSCEITTYNGHVNIFGYRQNRIPNFMCESSEVVQNLLQGLKDEAEDSALWIQLNHPIRLGDIAGCQWNWDYDMPFDWMEVWNGQWGPDSEENIKLWQSFLEQGRYLPATANSDFHMTGKWYQGYPCNNVWVERKVAKSIFSALASGHNYMTAEPIPTRSFAARIYQSSTVKNGSPHFVAFGQAVVGFGTAEAALSLELTSCKAYILEQDMLILRAWSETGMLWQMELAHSAFVAICDDGAAGKVGEKNKDKLVAEHDAAILLRLQADACPILELGFSGQFWQCLASGIATEASSLRFLRFELFTATGVDALGKTKNKDLLLLTNPVFFH